MLTMKRMRNYKTLPRDSNTLIIFSAGLSMILAMVNALMSVTVLAHRHRCHITNTMTSGSQHFIYSIYKTYILAPECNKSTNLPDVTTSDSVRIMAILLMVASLANLLAALLTAAVAIYKIRLNYMHMYLYVYICTSVAMFIVDMTIALHFGTDYSHMDTVMTKFRGEAENYNYDMIRLGAFFIMSLALKGYIGYAVNLVLITIITVYVVQFKQTEEDVDNDRRRRRMKVINSYEDTEWSPPRLDNLSSYYSRGPSLAELENDDDERFGQMKETSFSEIPSPPKRDESDPWVQVYRGEKAVYSKTGPLNIAVTNQSHPAYSADGQRRMPAPMKDNSTADSLLEEPKKDETNLKGILKETSAPGAAAATTDIDEACPQKHVETCQMYRKDLHVFSKTTPKREPWPVQMYCNETPIYGKKEKNDDVIDIWERNDDEINPWVPMYRNTASGYPTLTPTAAPSTVTFTGPSTVKFTNERQPGMQVLVKDKNSTSDWIRDRSSPWLLDSGASGPVSDLKDPANPAMISPTKSHHRRRDSRSRSRRRHRQRSASTEDAVPSLPPLPFHATYI